MNKLYVGNLSFQTTENELEKEFSQFGELKEVVLIKDKINYQSKGFAFITFASNESAQNAIQALNGKEIDGRSIKVNLAQAKEEKRGGGSNNRGGGFRGDRSNSGDKRGGGRRERW
jgi:cold-inducible RNA-binding protein